MLFTRVPSASRLSVYVIHPCRNLRRNSVRMLTRGGTVRLQIPSNFDMVDFVQVVSDRIGQMAGHGRRHRPLDRRRGPRVGHQRHQARQPRRSRQTGDRRVHVHAQSTRPRELVVRVLDQGEGFEPDEVADPLAPENILKSSGRGIFFMRSFMDDVRLRRGAARAAWKSAWSRNWQAVAEPLPPVFLATAIESVMQRRRHADGATSAATSTSKRRARSISSPRSTSEVEREFRALIAERFPDHAVLGEEFGEQGDRDRCRTTAGCSIPSTARPTTRTACRSSARPARSRSTGSPWSRRSTIRAGESCSPPSADRAHG